MRIGQRLIREELLTAAQLDEGLRTQVLRGGRLGTNLIELGHLQIDVLAEILGRHHGMPAALGRHFDLATPEIQARLSADIAAEWSAVPMGRLLGESEQIAVAVMEPLPEAGREELACALGSQIVLAVAPELRLLYHLEKVYDIPRSNRFIRVQSVDGTPPPGIAEPTDDDAYCDIQIHIHGDDEPARTASPGATTPAPAQAQLIQPGVPASAVAPAMPALPERRRLVEALPHDTPPADPAHVARIAIRRVSSPHAVQPETPATLEEVTRAIRQAMGRDRVGDLVVTGLRDFCAGILDVGIILVIRETIAIGWKGFVRAGRNEVVEAVAIPLNRPSVIYEPFRSGAMHIGPPSAASIDIDRRLWTLLRTAPPATVAVAPIVLEEQTVCMLYGHSTVPPDDAEAIIGDGMTELARATGRAFARLIRAAQR